MKQIKLAIEFKFRLGYLHAFEEVERPFHRSRFTSLALKRTKNICLAPRTTDAKLEIKTSLFQLA